MDGRNRGNQKQSLYFPEQLLRELNDEARRLDRSLSWVMQKAWRIAYAKIAAFPAPREMVKALE